MRLWFGKFKGSRVQDLPDDYLEWLASVDLSNERLRSAVEEERQRRIFLEQNGERINAKLVDEIVGAGLRSLAKKYHPDNGGSHEKMQMVNVAADWIKAQPGRPCLDEQRYCAGGRNSRSAAQCPGGSPRLPALFRCSEV